MTRWVRLSEDVFVAPQVRPVDMAGVAAYGFRTVINVRPDGEEETQPPGEHVAVAAADVGLEYHHIPVTAATLGDREVGLFKEALGETPGPVLAFCRSGTRAAMLWALSQAGQDDPDEIMNHLAKAGYEVEGLRARVIARTGNDAARGVRSSP